MKTLAALIMGLHLLTAAVCGQGTMLWNESVNGPFSNDYINPTGLGDLAQGTNSLRGVSELEPVGEDYFAHEDCFTFKVPAGMTIKAVYLQVGNRNVWTWLGDETYSTRLAYIQDSANGDLLPQWELPLIGSGAYGMYVSNHDFQPIASIANYRLDFVVIPEPAAWSMLCLSGVALFLKRQLCAQENRQEQ